MNCSCRAKHVRPGDHFVTRMDTLCALMAHVYAFDTPRDAFVGYHFACPCYGRAEQRLQMMMDSAHGILRLWENGAEQEHGHRVRDCRRLCDAGGTRVRVVPILYGTRQG